jgi:uncharacterized protein (DUF1501 family)
MITRLNFCRSSAAALIVPNLLQPISALAATPNSGILIAIMLVGGNDGLNTVIPLKQYGAYTDLRKPHQAPSDPSTALNIPLSELALTSFDSHYTVPASSASSFAFHPSMGAFRSLYKAGKVAVINGVGIPALDTNRLSHATGQFDWQSGTINKTNEVAVGWLGQSLDRDSTGTLPAMLSLTGEAPLLMQGYKNAPLAINPPLANFELLYGTGDYSEILARARAFESMNVTPSGTTTGDFIRAESQSATKLVNVVAGVGAREPASDYPQPQTYLALQLEQIARIVLSRSGVRAYFAVQAGYDTHSGQQSYQPALLSDLSESISTFYTYLAAKGASSNVTIMTFSDFGRRPAGNSTLGTDHGTSSVAFAVGDPVRGGTYGQYPDLTRLDEDGNLNVEVDFRNQISDIIGFLGGDANTILGKTYPKLGFI